MATYVVAPTHCSRQQYMPVLATHIAVLKDIYIYIYVYIVGVNFLSYKHIVGDNNVYHDSTLKCCRPT